VTDLDSYVNKKVDFKFNGAALRFDLSHALFSSFDIDAGTRLLLKTVARDPVLASSRRILDEGCGVGVIGLCAAKAFPEAEVLLRDRDSLAVAFAERNRIANRLRGAAARTEPRTGETGTERTPPRVEWGLLADGREAGPYDFVLSNLPAKAGAPVLAHFFDRLSGKRGSPLLVPGGRAGIVIVKPLAEAAAAWIAEAGLATVASGRGSMHLAVVVERPAESLAGRAGDAPDEAAATNGASEGPELSTYIRGEARFKLADLSYRARGFWGLPEFDTAGYGSSVAAELASRVCEGLAFGDALFLEPGVGHLAVWASRALGLKTVTAASRDELSLRAAGINLSSLPDRSRPEYRTLDALIAGDLTAGSFDLMIESPDLVPERDWTGPAWDLAGRLLRPGGLYLVYCSPTEMTRLEKSRPAGSAPWKLLGRKRKKGFAAAAWLKA